ncbi:MAG TPA: S8 family serine peptidase, partial [Ignavibacteriaceae bacterium]|nr:S8 family serine peptidase [Ignavibacteriaceae bacterium]
MKKLLLILVLAYFAGTSLFAQTALTPRLQRVLSNSSESDFIKTIVYLRDQVDLVALDEELYQSKATMNERAYRVITELKAKAANTQGQLLQYIEQQYSARDVFKYEPLWIVNAVIVEAKKSAILNMATRLDVEEIDFDAETYLEKYTVEEIDSPRGIEAVEPGLKIINADKLWQLGITGQGRLVMGEDTGVQHTHPALNYKWRGMTAPAAHAWIDPGAGSTTPSDCDGHGTHTVGTMVGLSPTTGDTIGVAIGAEWIAAKTICAGNSTSNHMVAYQWAMDPDGNPSTITDMPDAINNSWYDPTTVNECAGQYVQIFNALEAAGIAVVFSAGNNGPGVSTITMPKNINTNTVNVFSVANIVGSTYLGGSNDPIASSSSRGPSTCGGTGSLLIKPEVSAPGTSVRSSYTGGGYSSLTGTSMAAPHVAGSVALLRQAFPQKTGKEILIALYETAKDLGAVGEDNNYGKGLIDVLAAYQFLVGADSIPPTQITDLAVTNVTSNTMKLQWTTPFDSSFGGVRTYDIRYSTSNISDTTSFNNASQIAFSGEPGAAGTPASIDVQNLNFATQYYFAVVAKDFWGNKSPISNVVAATTLGAPQISVTPTSLHHVLTSNQVIVDTIRVSNISG